MNRTCSLFLAILLWIPLPVGAIEITAVYPQTVFAGTPVTVIGGPFSAEVKVNLGNRQLVPNSVGPRQLVFVTPQLPVGEYALFLQDGEETSRRTFSLRLEVPPPVITEISPDHLDECPMPERGPIILRGENLQPGTQLLLSDAVIPSSRDTEQIFSFTPPPLRAGSYGLQLVNPDGKRSLPHTLWVGNQPEIEIVQEGENFVTYYQILITGKNFFHNSVLLITEYPGGFDDLPPRQRFIPAQGGAAFHGDRSRKGNSESLSYQDCHTLIYNRYPPSGQAIRMTFRVGNPDGQQSDPYEVSLP